ncbi:hypothetical protein B8V81_0225 [Paenibacillus pasadenensis]|uniref:Uncharacterized protein n=1 Tax=Paenibacillus pasadenensis TaxID=217090 RepID=A0A2N5NCN7_9BACL|nr:hypothetical protein B8V81_0225 [Paenibacillus pasadenensis]
MGLRRSQQRQDQHRRPKPPASLCYAHSHLLDPRMSHGIHDFIL